MIFAVVKYIQQKIIASSIEKLEYKFLEYDCNKVLHDLYGTLVN